MGPDGIGAARDRGRLRAGDADREQVIDTLKAAFTQGRLTGDELGARTGQALTARTFADLDALTADIPSAPGPDGPPAPVTARTARPAAQATRWPLARATVKSGGCLVIAVASVRVSAAIDSIPHGPGLSPYYGWTTLLFVLAMTAVIMAAAILGFGLVTSLEQRTSRRRLPPPDVAAITREAQGM